MLFFSRSCKIDIYLNQKLRNPTIELSRVTSGDKPHISLISTIIYMQVNRVSIQLAAQNAGQI